MTSRPAPQGVRPVRAEDYDRVAEIYRRHDPDELFSGEELRRSDATFRPPHRHHRVVADEGAGAVGTGLAEQSPGSYHPRRFFLETIVLPEARGRGLGRALYAAVLEAIADARPTMLRLRAKASDERSVALAERYGYAETKRDWSSTFVPARLEPVRAREAAARLADRGLRVLSFAELERERGTETARRLAYETFSDVRRDVPRADPPTDISFDDYRRFVLEEPGFLAEGLFLALHGDEPAGMTQLFATEAGDGLATGLTGVRRAWRGRGIATALKVHALDWARRRGASTVSTQNDSTNVAMLAVNERLGFERGEVWLSMALELGEEGFARHLAHARDAARDARREEPA